MSRVWSLRNDLAPPGVCAYVGISAVRSPHDQGREFYGKVR